MTVLLPYGRTLPKQLATRSGILTRLVSTARVARPQAQSRPSKENPDGSHTSYLAFGASRSYATAAGRPASKPKAHTGRTTAKGTTKKTATKPKAQPKKSTKAKPKPKPKANPKPKVKKAPSASVLKREATQKRVSRKEMGLLRKEPKQLPERAWTVFCQQAGAPKGESVTSRMSAVGVRFKQISPEEREALNQTANENKVKNDAAYKAWVQTHTPLQIKEANNARIHLLREAKAKNVKKLGPYRPIKDDRLPKKPTPSYAFFVADRVVSGDFKGLTKSESFALIGREWKALSAGERKPYEDKNAADLTRYKTEHKTVYGTEPGTSRARA